MDTSGFLILTTFFFVLYIISIRAFIKNSIFNSYPKWERIAHAILMGVFAVLYVRFFIFDLKITSPSDEALYVSLIEKTIEGVKTPISGPGFVYFITLVNRHIGIDVDVATAIFGIVIGSMFLLEIYLIYPGFTRMPILALSSCLMLMTTSYFLWPMIY